MRGLLAGAALGFANGAMVAAITGAGPVFVLANLALMAVCAVWAFAPRGRS
jgi:hypothetical protein